VSTAAVAAVDMGASSGRWCARRRNGRDARSCASDARVDPLPAVGRLTALGGRQSPRSAQHSLTPAAAGGDYRVVIKPDGRTASQNQGHPHRGIRLVTKSVVPGPGLAVFVLHAPEGARAEDLTADATANAGHVQIVQIDPRHPSRRHFVEPRHAGRNPTLGVPVDQHRRRWAAQAAQHPAEPRRSTDPRISEGITNEWWHGSSLSAARKPSPLTASAGNPIPSSGSPVDPTENLSHGQARPRGGRSDHAHTPSPGVRVVARHPDPRGGYRPPCDKLMRCGWIVYR
jgi:hypothetical protein